MSDNDREIIFGKTNFSFFNYFNCNVFVFILFVVINLVFVLK